MKTTVLTMEKLENTELEDVEYLLLKVEESFGISLVENELKHIKTFGQFCDYIADKIQLDSLNDCTTQQAFYKLRSAVAMILSLDKQRITPNVALAELFPKKNRKTLVSHLETELDLKLNLLSPPVWITLTLIIVLIASFIGIFINFQFGLLGILFSISGCWISAKFGNELNFQTLGQIAQQMTRVNYLKSRRKANTFNKSEIEKVLTDLFITELALDKSLLTRESTFQK